LTNQDRDVGLPERSAPTTRLSLQPRAVWLAPMRSVCGQHEQLLLLRGQGTNSFRIQFTAGWAGAVCRQATKQWLALAIAAMICSSVGSSEPG
jgi:hypothetical protein